MSRLQHGMSCKDRRECAKICTKAALNVKVFMQGLEGATR